MSRKGSGSAAIVALALMSTVAPGSASAAPAGGPVDGHVQIDPRHVNGGDIPAHFVGVSIEWTLTDRYMGPTSRPAFANLLRNLGSGVLRLGGSSQDQVPFDATAADTDTLVTPHDLERVRATLDTLDADGASTPSWLTVLGTAMAPANERFLWRSPQHASNFARDGVARSFGDEAGRRKVAGISLGNEPDLTYSRNLESYLSDLPAYTNAEAIKDWPRVMPATSENIGPWQDFKQPPAGFDTRWFWNWPTILDAIAPALKEPPGPLEPAATDHFYPMARTCSVNTPYRCPTIARLLERERMDNFSFQVYTHAREAAARGLRYRMDETNTAAGRGAPGVSDVAASATWALDTLFTAACPQPPDEPGANADCHLGASGVNLHNSERFAYFQPWDGNAYYNVIRYDPTEAVGAPTPGPSYYALLFFSRFAQGTTGLRPVTLQGDVPVSAWQVRAGRSERRLFLINKGMAPVTLELRAPGARVALSRMTPFDPTGAGRTLDAPDVRIDGRSVAADGAFPGVAPTTVRTHGGRLPITIAPGEALVVVLHGHASLD